MLVSACSADAASLASTPAQSGPTANDGASAVHVRFELGAADAVKPGTIPWPDDLYLDKQARVSLRAVTDELASSEFGRSLVNALGDLDGFGVSSPVYFFLDGEIALNSLPQTAEESTGERASVFLIDADTGSPDAFQRVRVEVQWLADKRRLAVRPALGHPLTPGRRYAAIVTRRVKDTSGRPIEPAPDFAVVRDPTVLLTQPRWQQARTEYTPVLETLNQSGLARDEVVAMAVFRVQTTSKDFDAARRLVRMGKPPVPSNLTAVVGASALDAVLGKPATGDMAGAAHDQIFAMIHGTLPSPNFMADEPGTHGVWERDEVSQQLRVKRTDDVPFTFFVPVTKAFTVTSSPIVIYQHQRGRDRSDAIAIANTLAPSNIAVLAIDAPFQGLRAKPARAGQPVDTRNRFTGKAGADHFGDESGDFFGVQDEAGGLMPLHPFYARDAMRQGVVDLMTAVRFVEQGDFSVLTDLDPGLNGQHFGAARIGFIGEDLGAQLGVALAPYEPNLQALVLFAAGAGVAQEWWLSPADQDIFEQLARQFGRDPDQIDYDSDAPAFWPEFALYDTLTARAEPLAYAAALRRSPVNALLLMAKDDEIVSNLVTEALAVGLGATSVSGEARYVGDLNSQTIMPGQVVNGNFPIETERVTRVLQAYERADHALLQSRMGVQNFMHPPDPPFQRRSPQMFVNPMSAALSQVAEFFTSFFRCSNPPPTGAAVTAAKCSAAVTVANRQLPD